MKKESYKHEGKDQAPRTYDMFFSLVSYPKLANQANQTIIEMSPLSLAGDSEALEIT